jgi:hypothetical protein
VDQRAYVCPECRTWFEGSRCPACGKRTGGNATSWLLVTLASLASGSLLLWLGASDHEAILAYPGSVLLLIGLLGVMHQIVHLQVISRTTAGSEQPGSPDPGISPNTAMIPYVPDQPALTGFQDFGGWDGGAGGE